ncbi:MAG: Txe/YoeB family addiction module toxin [Ferruginibacter sp.]
MKNILLEKNAIEDLNFWSKSDLKLLKKIAELLLAISKDPFNGIGKPEALRGDLKGYWSRRINDEHRIVYTILTNEIIVISCRSHYNI